MWHWLPSELCNKSRFCFSQRRLFFLQLCLLVFCLHVAIMLLYGFVAWCFSGKQKFSISLSDQGATYVLMPLQKYVVQDKSRVVVAAEHTKHKKSRLIDHETYQRKKNSSNKKLIIKSKSKSSKNVASLSLKTGTKSQSQQASLTLSSINKNKVVFKPQKVKPAIVEIKELQESVGEQKKVDEPVIVPSVGQVADVQKLAEVGKSDHAVDSDVLQNQQAEIQDLVEVQESVQQLPTDQKDFLDSVDHDDDLQEEQVVFIGYEQLDQSLINSKIQHTVQQNWTPPVGMLKNISCDIRLKIGSDGTAVEAKIIKDSGVFVYDASARKTLLNIKYPKEVWNKTITITLGT